MDALQKPLYSGEICLAFTRDQRSLSLFARIMPTF
jgi:hypothetical protein